MPHPLTSHPRRTGSRAAILSLLMSAALLSAAAGSRAAETTAPTQPSSVSESPPSAVGPLSPVRRDPPAAAQSFSKQTPATTKPTIKMPPPSADNAALNPPVSNATPEPTHAEQTTAPLPGVKPTKPQPKKPDRATAAAPVPKAEQKQAQEAAPPRPHRKPPSTRSATSTVNAPGERRDRVVELDRMPSRERIHREGYSWSDERPLIERRGLPYPPPRVYGEDPGEIGPAPFAPPWAYRYRSFAWGPYPGMPGPRFGPPY